MVPQHASLAVIYKMRPIAYLNSTCRVGSIKRIEKVEDVTPNMAVQVCPKQMQCLTIL